MVVLKIELNHKPCIPLPAPFSIIAVGNKKAAPKTSLIGVGIKSRQRCFTIILTQKLYNTSLLKPVLQTKQIKRFAWPRESKRFSGSKERKAFFWPSGTLFRSEKGFHPKELYNKTRPQARQYFSPVSARVAILKLRQSGQRLNIKILFVSLPHSSHVSIGFLPVRCLFDIRIVPISSRSRED